MTAYSTGLIKLLMLEAYDTIIETSLGRVPRLARVANMIANRGIQISENASTIANIIFVIFASLALMTASL